MMNKTIGFLAILLLTASGPAFAQGTPGYKEGTNCFQGSLANEKCPALADDPDYVKENFAFNISAGVQMNKVESASAIGVNTAHKDGLHTYGGSSEGGAVKKCGTKRDDFTTALVPGTPTPTNGCGAATPAPG